MELVVYLSGMLVAMPIIAYACLKCDKQRGKHYLDESIMAPVIAGSLIWPISIPVALCYVLVLYLGKKMGLE